jgi:hypothetical protein
MLLHDQVLAGSPSHASAAAVPVQADRCEVHHVYTRLPLRAVALGDNGTYVVLFENGQRSWSSGLPDSLQKRLEQADSNNEDIADVALGRNQGSDTYNKSATPADHIW